MFSCKEQSPCLTLGDCCHNLPASCKNSTIQSEETVEKSQLIQVSPSYIRFPYDECTTNRVKTLRVFNKTKNPIRLNVIPPQSDTFLVYLDQRDLYASSSLPIYVRCNPKDNQISLDSLEIQAGEVHEAVRVPLELLPSTAWFQIPKYVALPPTSIDKQVNGLIRLPQPPYNRIFGFVITSPHTNIFNVEPKKGELGGPHGVDALKVMFLAHEYLTLTYKLQIKFTGIPCTQNYDIYITGRCVPNLHNELERRDVLNIECLTEEVKNAAVKHPNRPRLTLRLNGRPNLPSTDEYASIGNLLTPAGVMKFLIHKDAPLLGPMGIDKAQVRSHYYRKRTDFQQELQTRKIKQKALEFQHNKAFIGEDSIDAHPERLKQMYFERDRQMKEYLASIGENPTSKEDFLRTKTQYSNQKLIRDVNEAFVADIPAAQTFDRNEFLIQQGLAKRLILRPFVQAAYKIMVKYRVRLRIKKIRALIESLKVTNNESMVQ